ncbi:ATP-binding cassette domain-containing protein [Roseomonas sp. PWR1]|uniref:ATP-binding cassette domain-containing protein n=1 Tax=Roseomonas nitratireducens TaxID=2820810 RepID=A0ABS4AWI1_9PROT|nr:ATP-binding cassette domain-containing protein [Neoroseomonas nitratireducens]MBP0465736.1 ATP-binding cassette domain-containing protein [Neoroseomonas nitratireducens]
MVRFARVALCYPDPRGRPGPEVLRDVSFTLGEGTFTWILGPSGAGKTSVLRLMQAALRPTGGEVELLGVALSRARRGDLPALRRRIGVVHQEFRLLSHLSAWDNVALPLRLASVAESSIRADVAELLQWIGLDGKEDRRPEELSGGEQQRLTIARAIVARPSLLVADEPTSELDARQARRTIALLAELNRQGTTVVVATHSEDLPARHPARMLVLEGGRLVGDG